MGNKGGCNFAEIAIAKAAMRVCGSGTQIG